MTFLAGTPRDVLGDVPAARVVAGGIVAHNDEGRVERSIRSLLGQELPPGYEWGRVSVVASGCTDRTVNVAESLAAEDPRLDIVVEPRRRGKAAALREILRRAEGDSVVLLNSDAVALPGSVAELLRTGEGKLLPYAVMARPVVPPGGSDRWTETVRWMWDVHHRLHEEMLADGKGAHLSDELLLLSLPTPAPLAEGIINDGSFLGVWFAQHGGGCWYAPQSRVEIAIPPTVEDHVWQRRRIHVGNAQVRRLLGRPPETLPQYLLDDPRSAFRTLRAVLRSPRGMRHMARVAFWELVAHSLAAWDRLPPARDHIHWRRIRDRSALDPRLSDGARSDPESAALGVDQRVRALLGVAREFGTGLPLPRLTELLPAQGPATPAELEAWLLRHPDVARVEAGRVFRPDELPLGEKDRAERAVKYRQAARRLLSGSLRDSQRWVRSLGITGSVAYGEPRPGDDLDFLVITRSGALWWFLATTYLRLRLGALRDPAILEPEPCFNYLIDERRAEGEFEARRDFLFAREALTAEILVGDPYYRGLLAGASWMSSLIPRLYARRTVAPDEVTPRPAPPIVRVLNALVYPWLAAYLQVVGLRRNARRRRTRDPRGTFRTVTEWRRLAFASRRFDELRHRYEEGTNPSDRTEGMAGPSRIPTAR